MPLKQGGSSVTLAALLDGVLIPTALTDAPVSGLQLDSRKVRSGDVFLAVPGITVDGRDYIDQVLEAGAVAVFAEAEGLSKVDPQVIAVANLSQRLSEVANNFYGAPSTDLAVTGITGTNGKTTCSHLLAQLLSQLNGPAAAIGTLGFGVFLDGTGSMRDLGMTTPDAVASQALLAEAKEQKATSVVMEVSSHSLDQDRVAAVQFDTAVFTNLSRDHLDYHGDMSSYAKAKFKLFQQSGLQHAVINGDDSIAPKLVDQLPGSLRLIRYGLADTAEVRATRVVLGKAGFSADIVTPWGSGHCYSRLLGEFNIRNLLAVISVALLQGHSLDSILAAIPKLEPVSGRMEPIAAPDLSIPSVIVDYAHTPDALQQALQTLRAHCDGKLWVVFGCGGDRDKGKRAEMGRVATALADEVLITSDNPRSEQPMAIMLDIAESVVNGRLIEQREAAIRTAVSEAEPNDVILVAGKGHESYQQIGEQRVPFSDLDASRRLLSQYWGGKA